MSQTISYSDTLSVETCWCGTTYAIPTTLRDYMMDCKRNGRQQPNVYCPLGHTWFFSGEAEVDKVKRQLANIEEELRIERASHSSTKGELTKSRKRAARGVCPCCKRSFVNVARHVAHMHPEHLEATK